MSGFDFVSVMCLLVILTGPSSALLWRPVIPTYPPTSNVSYYEAFQKVPPPKVTADELLTNFLHIRSQNRSKRSQYIEDSVFVLDGSGSVGSCEFDKAKKALKYITQIDQADGRYAAVTFSNYASVNFKFVTKSSALSKIMGIAYPSGMTNTQAGLEEAKKLFDDPSSGVRVASSKKVLLVTDGHSNVQTSLTEQRAEALKNAGVLIHVVAVGGYIGGIQEMVRLSSLVSKQPGQPPSPLLYRVTDYNGFWEVVELMLKKAAPGTWQIVQNQYDPPC